MLEEVDFRAEDYGPEIAEILNSQGGGHRPMPLVQTAATALDCCEAIQRSAVSGVVRAGLYLYCSCWDQGHVAADDGETPENHYWHAIAHRQEPDPGNAAYWFRKVGKHPIFPALREAAAALGYDAGSEWNPDAFVDFCGSASRRAGSEEEAVAMKIQLLEWQLLFDYCAQGRVG
jgi:hypothetical protein